MEGAMTMKRIGSTLRAGMLMAVGLAVALPAYAQLGSVSGRVVDQEGNPVADAELVFEFVGEMNYRFEGKTQENGTYVRAGLSAVGGRWTIIARKDGMAGFISNVDVPLSDVIELDDIVIIPGGATPDSALNMSEAEMAERNRQAMALKSLFDEVNVALEADAFDEAITKLNEAAGRVNECSECYLRLGDVYVKKGELDTAEEAYQQAIDYDPTSAEGYDGLAAVYNDQRKFTEAAEASMKASELRGSGGGVQDATSLFNAGAIFVNSGNMVEAQAQFEKAIAADPTMAEAHYQLAMTLINQGKIAEAIPALEQYLTLAPDGPNAETAKMMLPELQKMQ
jgi:tetratricopeptide (TPR) repeat protein